MLFGSLLQLAALATAAVIKHKPDSDYVFSCDTPIPPLPNGTMATSWAQYLDETGEDLDSGGQGAVDHFGGPAGKAPMKWPRNSENLAKIPYCYYNEHDRDATHEVIEAAIKSWMRCVYIQYDHRLIIDNEILVTLVLLERNPVTPSVSKSSWIRESQYTVTSRIRTIQNPTSLGFITNISLTRS